MRFLDFLVTRLTLLGCCVVSAGIVAIFVGTSVATAEVEKSLEALTGLGAGIEQSEDGQVVAVDLSGVAGVNSGLEHLRGLSDLRHVDLPPLTNDAGLECLDGLLLPTKERLVTIFRRRYYF